MKKKKLKPELKNKKVEKLPLDIDMAIFNEEDLEAINFPLVELIDNVKLIQQKEPEFYKAVFELVTHLAKTYQDKYESTKHFLNTKEQLYDYERGEIIASYQLSRYLQRFLADKTFLKGGNKNDLVKICHYALFAMVRKNRFPDEKKDKDFKD